MSRSQFSGGRRIPTAFLDRREHLELAARHVELLLRDSRHFKVFEVIGLGGAGKTRLLNELHTRTSRGRAPGHLLWVSLEAEASVTEIGPLRTIREQVGIDCALFDSALFTYWDAIGQPTQLSSWRITQSLAFKTADIGRATAGIPLPLSFAVDVYRAASHRLRRLMRYRREEFEAIDALRHDPAGIRARLPHYLGLDIARRLDVTGRTLAVFYDGYDRQTAATIASKAPWLRELIGTLDRGLHLIATRESMHWPDGDWDRVVQKMIVGELPDAEARSMIRARLGTLPADVEDRLIHASRKIPFFLEAALGAYDIQSENSGPVDVRELPSSPASAVAYLLDHLPRPQRRIAVAIATVQMFDAGLYAHLVRALNVPLGVDEFDEFASWFFNEEIGGGLYKTHDVLTEFVRDSDPDEPTRLAALDAAASYLRYRADADGLAAAPTALSVLRGLIVGWESVDEMPLQAVETLIDACYVLYDAGHWRELSAIASEVPHSGRAIAAVAEFFAALTARRTVSVARALELFERLEPRANALGRHERSAELEVAYLSELAGNYGKAREQFRALDRDGSPIDPADRTQLRVRLYHADMLTMDGGLAEASHLLLEAYELVGRRSPLDWAELVRHRGHTFRFSFLFEQAETLYLLALEAAGQAPGLLAKLHTNLAEARCWHDPEQALDAAAVSSDLNLRLGNRIELAKCDAARGIAFAKLGEVAAAREAVVAAIHHAETVGYPSGVAFALQAASVVEGLAGDDEGVLTSAARLRQSIQELGTYAHLQVVPAWLRADDSAFVDAAVDVDWIEPDDLEARLRRSVTR